MIVDVLIPVAVDTAYSYRVPQELAVQPGDFVAMPLGTRVTTGVVWSAREGDGGNQRYDKANDRTHGVPPQSSLSVIFFTSSPFIRTTTATGRPPSSSGVTLTAR